MDYAVNWHLEPVHLAFGSRDQLENSWVKHVSLIFRIRNSNDTLKTPNKLTEYDW